MKAPQLPNFVRKIGALHRRAQSSPGPSIPTLLILADLTVAGCGRVPKPKHLPPPRASSEPVADIPAAAGAGPKETDSGGGPIVLPTPQLGHQVEAAGFSYDEGLSQSVVTSIAQGDTGFMWFGTQDGLNPYDGCRATVFKRDPGDTYALSSNFVLSLSSDQEGTLWIGTSGRGLSRFDGRHDALRRRDGRADAPAHNAHRDLL